MKRIAALLLAAALALGCAACAPARANTDVPDVGSQSAGDGADNQASTEIEPAETAAIEADADEIFDTGFDAGYDDHGYDPIDLCRDNPLGDADVASVKLRVEGVGEQELTGGDEATILGIAQNDTRAWQDQPDFPNGTYFVTDYMPPAFIVTLASGQELVVRAHTAQGTPSNILSIDGEDYALTADEYDAFNEVHETVRDEIIAQAGEAVRPYADLAKADLAKIERVRHYTEEDQSEQLLTNAQADLVIKDLNALEIEPATVDFDPEALMGGGYEYFVLWFKDGSSVAVGAYQYYQDYDNLENSYSIDDSYPVAYIDGAVYRCNPEYANDMYWNYEEFADYYQKRYLYGREVADHPFEEMQDDEITELYVGIDDDGTWRDRLVPLDSDLVAEAGDVLRSLLITDGNKLERTQRYDLDWSVRRSSEITIGVNDNESVDLGIDGDRLVINQADYEEDADVLAALQGLIDAARESAEALLAENGETQTVTVSSYDESSEASSGAFSHKSYTFELPQALVKHEDGYYPDGYTLDTAPLSVQVMAYDVESSFDRETYLTVNKIPDDAMVSRVEAEMEAAKGEGYRDSWILIPGGSFRMIVRSGSGEYDREIFLVEENLSVLELDIVQREAYDIGIDAVYSLIRETLEDEYLPVG